MAKALSPKSSKPVAIPAPAFTYVTQVKSNVKGGVDIALGPKTLIIGPTGSGKSRIANSVELALSGVVSDIVGRDTMARELDLFALAPNREGTLEATALLSNDQKASWSSVKTGDTAKKAKIARPDCINKESVFPLRLVREALAGSSETTRKFLIEFAKPVVTFESILAGMGPISDGVIELLQLEWDIASSAVDADRVPGTTLLLRMLEKAKARANAESTRASVLRDVATEAAADLAPPPTDEEFSTARRAVGTAKAAFEKAVRADAAATANANRQAQVERERAGFERAKAKAISEAEALILAENAAKAALAKIESDFLDADLSNDIPEVIYPLIKVLEYQVAQGGILVVSGNSRVYTGNCLVCGSNVPCDDLKNNLDESVAAVASVTAFREQKRILTAKVAYATAAVDACDAAVARLDSSIARATTELEDFAVAMNDEDVPRVDHARDEVTTAEAALRELELLQGRWDAAQKPVDTSVDAGLDSARWKDLTTALSIAMGHLLDEGVEGLRAKVQAYLPGNTFSLRLRDGERSVCQMGFEREGVLHTALSGFEWAQMNLALAGVIAKKGELSVLIPEDRAVDADTLAKMLTVYENAPMQVIIATPTRPTTVSAAWTIIERG